MTDETGGIISDMHYTRLLHVFQTPEYHTVIYMYIYIYMVRGVNV